MAEFEHKQNTGSIFKNSYKQQDNHPDYKGRMNVDGKLYDIALWVKRPDGKDPFFSMSIQEPYVKPEQQSTESAPIEEKNDLPF